MNRWVAIVVAVLASGSCLIAGLQEIFLWDRFGPRILELTDDAVISAFLADEHIRLLAWNQGIYNVCLAALLIWPVFISEPQWRRKVAVAGLLFLFVVGVFGGITIGSLLPWIGQAGVALVGLALVFGFGRKPA